MTPLLLALALLTADPAPEPDPAAVDVVDAIACKLEAPTYTGFALALASGGPDAPDARHGWRKVDSHNPFMNEYVLPAPITVAGHYSTTHIGFTATGVVAILDQPDPSLIAREEGITNAMDAEPLIDSLVAEGKGSREEIEKKITFRKFLGNKVIAEHKIPPAAGESFGLHTTITREISNVSSAPGKTLYGCSYSQEITDKDGKPL